MTFANHPTVYPTIQIVLLQKLHKIRKIYENTRNSTAISQPADFTETLPIQSAISVRELNLNLVKRILPAPPASNGVLKYSSPIALQFAAEQNLPPAEIADILRKLLERDRQLTASNPYTARVWQEVAIAVTPTGWIEITVSDAGLSQWLHDFTKSLETQSQPGFHGTPSTLSVNSLEPTADSSDSPNCESHLRTYTEGSPEPLYSSSLQENLRTYTGIASSFTKTLSIDVPAPFLVQQIHARYCQLLQLGQRELLIQCEEIYPAHWRITDPDAIPWQTVLPTLPFNAPERQLIWQLEVTGNGLNAMTINAMTNNNNVTTVTTPAQWLKLAVALSQAMQRFESTCPVVKVDLDLAQVRLGLGLIAQGLLRSLLDRLHIATPIEL